MKFEDYLKKNLLKKTSKNIDQIFHQIQRAEQDLKTAEANLKIDPTWALTIAYHSMIRAGRALIFYYGYLPTTQYTHKTIVDCSQMILGDNYKTLISKFNRLRRRRHHFIYDSENHVNIEEAQSALKTANDLIVKIKEQIEEK